MGQLFCKPTVLVVIHSKCTIGQLSVNSQHYRKMSIILSERERERVVGKSHIIQDLVTRSLFSFGDATLNPIHTYAYH